jgi:hypothetical protein
MSSGPHHGPPAGVFHQVSARAGYVAPRPPLNASQVAAPVSVHVIRAKRYCLTRMSAPRYGFGAAAATDLGPYLPCTGPLPASDNRPGGVIHGTLIIFSWTGRQPVTSSNSQYQFFVDTRGCGGQGGSTFGAITAGERLTRAVIVPTTNCTGNVSGAIGYDPNLGPGAGDYASNDPGHDRVAPRRPLHSRHPVTGAASSGSKRHQTRASPSQACHHAPGATAGLPLKQERLTYVAAGRARSPQPQTVRTAG